MPHTLAPQILKLIATVLPLSVFALMGIVVLLRPKAVQTALLVPFDTGADGTPIVPIHGLYLRRSGFAGGVSHNNINPRFAIAPDGIRYRVFRESRLPFANIDHVELRERFGFVYLLFVNAAGPRLLSVKLGNRGVAKQVLDALPGAVALTPEAATIRDGTAAAGTSGLRLYSGRFA